MYFYELFLVVNEFKSGDYGNLGTYLPARQG